MFDSDYGRKAGQVDRIIIIFEPIYLGLYYVLAILAIFCMTNLSAPFPLNFTKLAENIFFLHLSVTLKLFCAIEQAFIV